MKVCIFTLGCKVNQCESNVIAALLTQKGFEVITHLDYADIFLINTCAVTNEAQSKSRQAVARVLKLNPNARIIAIGCATQLDNEQFIGMNNVTYISGATNKFEIIDKINEEGCKIANQPTTFEDSAVLPQNYKTRAFIKVQDGCNNFCSYCIVPYLRGRSRSRSVESALKEVSTASGLCNEIVLTGIDLSSFGKDIGSSLSELIELLPDDLRFRLGSLEVNVITDRFLQACKAKSNFCQHFHLSLQSGCDSVLASMNRHYTTKQYYEAVKLIKSYFIDATITTDIIIGYPLESDVDFATTLEFVSQVGFDEIHIFPYSHRKGTVSSKYKELPTAVVKERVSKLTALKKVLYCSFLTKYINKVDDVLIEEYKQNCSIGLTPKYLKVYIKSKINEGSIVKVKMVSIYKDGLLGEIYE